MPTSAPHSSTQASLLEAIPADHRRRNRPYPGNECQSRICVLAEAITTFQGQSLDEHGKRCTLLFTSATAALRGNVTTSAFSAAKFRAALALSESEQGVWKGKYTRMCMQLQYARYMFADQPCFLGGARMSPPSSLLLLSDDLSLRTLQVVIDGGTYMIQTAHIAWELN